MIRRLNKEDTLRSAQLHKEGMPNDFLPSFGMKFLTTLHEEFLKTNEIIALGYEYKSTLAGCIMAAVNTNLVMKQIFLKGTIRLLFPILISVFRKPKHMFYIYQTLVYGKSSRASDAELLIISVDEKFRKQKIGTKLMQSLKKKLKKFDIKTFQVNALSTNAPANAYYQKMGGVLVRSIKIYGRVWNTYLFNL